MIEDLKKKALMGALGDLKTKATKHSLSPLLSVKICVEGPESEEPEKEEDEDEGLDKFIKQAEEE